MGVVAIVIELVVILSMLHRNLLILTRLDRLGHLVSPDYLDFYRALDLASDSLRGEINPRRRSNGSCRHQFSP